MTTCLIGLDRFRGCRRPALPGVDRGRPEGAALRGGDGALLGRAEGGEVAELGRWFRVLARQVATPAEGRTGQVDGGVAGHVDSSTPQVGTDTSSARSPWRAGGRGASPSASLPGGRRRPRHSARYAPGSGTDAMGPALAAIGCWWRPSGRPSARRSGCRHTSSPSGTRRTSNRPDRIASGTTPCWKWSPTAGAGMPSRWSTASSLRSSGSGPTCWRGHKAAESTRLPSPSPCPVP